MNIWLIHVDCLPVWALGVYGNEWLATPNLDTLASRSVVFDRHFADQPDPLRLETLLPYYRWFRLSEKQDFGKLRWIDFPLPLEAETSPTWDDLRESIRHAVESWDAWLGEWLADHDIRDDWLFVLAGRGLEPPPGPWPPTHTSELHESKVHLPLIIHTPQDAGAGRRVLEITQTPDLAATIVELLGLPTSPTWHGQSLVPLCRGPKKIRPYALMTANSANEWALQTPNGKIIVIVDSSAERLVRYYVKPDDLWEVCDLRQVYFDYTDALAELLCRARDMTNLPGPIEYPPLPSEDTNDGNRETR